MKNFAFIFAGLLMGIVISVSAQEIDPITNPDILLEPSLSDPSVSSSVPIVEKELTLEEKYFISSDRNEDLEILVSKYAKLYDTCRN
jgi:hypothetical protein